MCFVNRRLHVVPDFEAPDQFASLSPQAALDLRNAFDNHTELIDLFVDVNPFDFVDAELDIVSSWRHRLAGSFFVFRYLRKYTVFLDSGDKPTAYGVIALTRPFEDVVGPYLPVLTEAVLLPFQDKIVYDGLLSGLGISIRFGPGMRRSLNEDYKSARTRMGIVTVLPIGSVSPAAIKPSKTPKSKATKTASNEVRETLEVVAFEKGLIPYIPADRD